MQPLGPLPVLAAAAVVTVTLLLFALQRVILRPLAVLGKLRAQGVPGYPFTPLLGNLVDFIRIQVRREKDPEFAASTLGLYFHFEGTQKYGKIWSWCFGQSPCITVTDPAIVRQVFVTKSSNFVKSEITKKQAILGKGIATAEGALWSRQRKLMTPFFHMVELKRLFPIMAELTQQCVKSLQEQVAAHPEQPIMIDEEMTRLTLDIITGTAFGSGLDGEMKTKVQQAFAGYLKGAPMNQMLSMVFPPYAYFPTEANRVMWRAHNFVRSTMKGVVTKRLEQTKSNKGTGEAAAQRGDAPMDLLQLMINTREGAKDGSSDTKSAAPEGVMSEEQLVDECVTLLFGGHETTSVLLSWAMLLLSQNKEWQEKAREDVLELSSGPDWVPDYESLNQMKLVTAILNESLRLYPPGAGVVRTCVQETKVSEDLTIPAGCDVFAPIEVLHLSEELWGADAKEFNPQRFAEGVSKASAQPGAFIPFGLGPRVCLGQTFAMMEAKVILSMILKSFSWEVVESYQHHPFVTITTRPKYGVPVIMTPLKAKTSKAAA